MSDKSLSACPWAEGDMYKAYHDNEWGLACYDSQRLFEKICLEGQQAGLSWITVLKKRRHYRACFYDFDAKKIAVMTDDVLEALLKDAGLIRNRLKIYAIRKNALAYLAMLDSGEDFADFIWAFVDHTVLINQFASMQDMPTQTPISQTMSKALKLRGFTFVGPTMCYAFMQSMGLVDDHLISCPQHSNNR
ncbi:MAG: DNA-3-methyladenine glycosylase I [Pseudomonadales bacterium]|nr:DNA-3-methyladenine glycosylase I [Pseudomonadales bacterium]